MKKLFVNIILVFASLMVFCQTRPVDAYFAEELGYFINVKPALNGYVFTDNYCNTLYYLNNGELQTLVSAPGCGRYFNVSTDGKFVGYKHISDAGQAPAVVNLENGKIEFLNPSTILCGQPTFFNDGLAYTVDNNLIILREGKSEEYDLGYYSNIVTVSPDGNFVAYSDDDRIMLKNLSTSNVVQLSEGNKLSSYPQFSPDGQKVLYQSDKMYVYELLTGKTFDIGYGLAPKWSFDSQNIVFHNTVVEEYTLKNAEIYSCNYQNPSHLNLTNTLDKIEMQPVFVSDSEVIYSTYSDREIYKLNTSTLEKELIYKHEGDFNITFFNVKSAKSEVLIPGEFPYTHQVYDTPDTHYGYGSCAPTCAIMAVAYYNILPEWPTPVTKLFPHTSYYGSYVATRYRLNEHYFTESSQPSGGGSLAYGGYGYMWGLGSPYSQMRNYMELHYFESSQLFNNSVTWASVLTEIDAQFPLPMCVMLTVSGHLILAKGYIENQHTLIFSEPYGDKNTPSWPSYDGQKAYYDWPGYNNGYQNLDYNGTYGVIAWTVTAHSQEVTYNDTIIDDLYYQHGFEINNSENGSAMRYFRDQNAGYNGHAWYTLTEASANDICWVHWIPTLNDEGFYKVSAYIPSECADARNAPYKIKHGDETTTVLINQNEFNDEWAILGTFEYVAGDEFWVYLGDSTGFASDSIAYDAVKFELQPAPTASFTVASQNYCVGEIIQIDNNSLNYVSCAWDFPGSLNVSGPNYSPNVVYAEPGTYDAQLICYGMWQNDTIIIEDFVNILQAPEASFTASSSTAFLPDAIVGFINTSIYADWFEWNFGNGQYSSDNNPFVLYTVEGDYYVSLTAHNLGCPESVFQLDNPISVYGISAVESFHHNQIDVFPNPAKDFISINSSCDIYSFKIFNNLGQIVFSTEKSNLNKIDISDLPEGIYMLQLVSDGKIFAEKIVVER